MDTAPPIDAAIAKVMSLPTAERIRLAQELWDSAASDTSSVPTPESQVEEVRRRKAMAEADPESLLSEDEFWRRVDGE